MTAPGGMLYTQYSNPTMGERHTLRLHVCPFDPAPVSTAYGENDRLYTHLGAVNPAENSVLQTFAGLAARWQPYYGPEWLFTCDSIWQRVGTGLDVLSPPPIVTGFLGTDTTAASSDPRLSRRFRLLSTGGTVRHLHLAQVAGEERREGSFEVGPSSGGLDARDRNLMNYISGGTGGAIVMADGQRCYSITEMRIWWARRLLPAATGGGSGGSGGLTGDCLDFPNGASICNPAIDTVTINTPTAAFSFTPFGITLPGGHRLEIV